MFAVVLNRKNFREYDQIIVFYTLEKGKLELLAKGVKKIISKNSASLEPFSFLEIDIVQGKEVSRLVRSIQINYFSNIREDLKKIVISKNAIEILDKVLEVGLPDKEIFLLLISFLEFLEMNNIKNLLILDSYILKLFRLLGFDISFNKKLDQEFNEIINFLLEKNWENINNFKIDQDKYKKIHKIIYEFILYYGDKKFQDWGKTCLF